MDVKINKLPKSEVELIIELSEEDLKPFLNQAVKEISNEVKVPGFRPGKVPYDILEKQVGSMKIYQQAAEEAIKDSYPKAVIENKIITIGSPKISIEKIAPNNPFIYKAVAALMPEVKLGDYKKVKIDKKEVKVVEKDIDETIFNLRKMFGKEIKSTKTAIKGNKLIMDMDTYVDQVPIDGGTSKDHSMVIGEGHFIPGFEDNLIGLAEGQSKEFKLNFPKEYHRKDLASKPVEFKVKIKSIFNIELPPLDDNFAKMAGQFEKMEDLRKQIQGNITEERKGKEHQRWELAIVSQVIENSKFDDIPELLIESELHKMLHELETEITNQGMKFEDYLSSIKKTKDELQKEFRPQAEKRVKTAIVLRKIAELEKITVQDSEIDRSIEEDKKKYQSNPDVLKQMGTEEYRSYLKNVLRSRKVFEYLEKK